MFALLDVSYVVYYILLIKVRHEAVVYKVLSVAGIIIFSNRA